MWAIDVEQEEPPVTAMTDFFPTEVPHVLDTMLRCGEMTTR